MKFKIFVIILLLMVVGIFIFIIDATTALDVDKYVKNDMIEYSDNKERLYNNIYNFIEDNDDLLIGLSSFEMSNILNENYDYIVNYAINYILDNKENYKDIIDNNYISTDEIFKITDNVFGKKNFYINDEKIIYLEEDDRRFEMDINKLEITSIINDNIFVVVDYVKDGISMKYKYSLLKKKNRLVIENIEVLE